MASAALPSFSRALASQRAKERHSVEALQVLKQKVSRALRGKGAIGTEQSNNRNNRDRRDVFRYLFCGRWQAVTRRSIRKKSGLALQTRAQHAAPLQVSRFSLSSGVFQAGKRGPELAGGEVIEGAKAGGEFGGGQAAVAVEAAEKIGGGGFPFLGVAFHATGDQVAVGIGSRPRLRHDVVQALYRRRSAAQTVEALVAL